MNILGIQLSLVINPTKEYDVVKFYCDTLGAFEVGSTGIPYQYGPTVLSTIRVGGVALRAILGVATTNSVEGGV